VVCSDLPVQLSITTGFVSANESGIVQPLVACIMGIKNLHGPTSTSH